MEQYKEILTQLKSTTNILQYIEQRKKQCLQENQNSSKQNPKQFGTNGKKMIGINRMMRTTIGGTISASSDYIEDDRKVVITGRSRRSCCYFYRKNR